MKITSRFCVALVTVIFFFTVAGSLAVGLSIDNIRRTNNDAIACIITTVREKYPEITDDEIITLLNSTDFSVKTNFFLKSYGIRENDFYLMADREHFLKTIAVAGALFMSFGAAVLIFFWAYVRYKTKQEKKLTDYLVMLNSGDYRVLNVQLTEDKNSVLSSEIYKTTVMLREKSEQTRQEKLALKDSLSDISHQLKTPLTSMLIMIDNIIENEEMPPQLRNEFLNDIRQSVDHISFLTRSLLTLSKLDADTIEFHAEKVQLKALAAHCFANVDAIARDKGVTLRQDCEDVSLECDEKWVSEALTNIIKNCVEHTQKGGIVTMKGVNDSLLTKITISDNGCGIEKNDLPHIFERFYKGKNADENSIGIGLALSKSIIEKCGGDIKVFSEPDVGTTFVIKFFKMK